MTETEQEFLAGLVTAAWPLAVQIAFAVGTIGGYWLWSRLFYAAVDPWLRRWLGGKLGARVVWVLRHSASYQTPLELGLVRQRRFRWTWGIEREDQRTLSRDAAASLLCFLVVNLAAGLWPIALFLLVALQLKALSYVVLVPGTVAAIAIYSIFWTGRYPVAARP